MGQFANPAWVKFLAWIIAIALTLLNLFLIYGTLTGLTINKTKADWKSWPLFFINLRVRNGRIGKMKYKEERLSRDRLFKCRKNCEHTRNQRRSSGHFENGFSRRTLSKGATLLLFQEKKHQLNWS